MATVEIHPTCLAEDLASIPGSIRAGIFNKIAVLETDPRRGRPLTGKLRGHRRITYGRYRIVYRWDQAREHVLVWLVGLRAERLYAVAESVSRKRTGR
ncbi:MAG: type II toxin-antitoxin system RelE/ParE family toxin [Armatimonadetes bacterium]|nr:type II toxin-antitoxin system RelE/ParE family toxin [Armatimonadota bacterium]